MKEKCVIARRPERPNARTLSGPFVLCCTSEPTSMDVFDGVFTAEAAQQALSVLIKLGIAVILGGAVGWEREMHGRPAGVRTHMLVVLGVTLFSEVSKNFGGGDPARIAAQIVTGIGFLGAGTILRFGVEIRGLTTAASIWAVAGIGMAVSVGGYFLIVATVATVLALFTLTVVDNLEKRFSHQSHPRVMQIETDNPENVAAILELIGKTNARMLGLRIVTSSPVYTVHLDIAGDRRGVFETIAQSPGVRSANWVEPGA